MQSVSSTRIGASRRASNSRARRLRVAVEGLEARLVLSTFVVNTIADQVDPTSSKTLSLVDAVARANAQSSGSATISFDPTVFAKPQTINLTGSGTALELSHTSGPIGIIGPAAGITVVGSNLTIDQGVTASLSAFTIAGITNNGNLTVSNSTVSNDAFGGISNSGMLLLQNSTVSDNDGNSTGAHGGGLSNNGMATVSNCAFFGNVTTTFEVPGIATASAGPGGTIRPDLGPDYTNGGAISNAGILTLTNSTLAGNDGDNGGGLYNSGTAVVSDCTIYGNNQDLDNDGGTLTLANSIVAGSTSGTIDVTGAIKSLGHNLIGLSDSTSSGFVSSDLIGTAAHPVSAGLSSLGNHGGPTLTQFPVAGSPAIGAGSVALIPAGATTDQRGFARVVGGKVDIGAVELQKSTVVTVTPPAAQSVVAGKAASISLGAFADPSGAGPFIVDVNWGDGSPDTTFSVGAAGALGSQTHSFAGAPAFTASVVVTDAAGDVSQPGSFSVTPSGAVISGTVFNDFNGDGIEDNEEGGLGGVQVYADLGNVGYFLNTDPTTTTDGNGNYSLGGLASGNYIIRQIAPFGFAQTAPVNGLGRHISVAVGQMASGQNFGDKTTSAQPASITGAVFNDVNGNGIQDNGESGLPNVQIYADLGNVGYFVAGDPTTVTNAGGGYTLPGLNADSYIVRQVAPSGFVQTTPLGGLGRHVTVNTGQTLAAQNFGDKSTAPPSTTIAGTVFDDENADGVEDNGESGLGGVQVYLDLGNVGFYVVGDPTTSTALDGSYSLSGLAAGNYIVRQIAPPDFAQTLPTGGLGRHVTVAADQTLSGQNFGDKTVPPPSNAITGYVFNDANGNGTQQGSEAGLGGVQVYLDLGNVGYFVAGDPTTSTNTAAGSYSFVGIAAGNYIVRQVLPSGYVQTSPANGFGHHVTVVAAQSLMGEDFGDMLLKADQLT